MKKIQRSITFICLKTAKLLSAIIGSIGALTMILCLICMVHAIVAHPTGQIPEDLKLDLMVFRLITILTLLIGLLGWEWADYGIKKLQKA